MKPAPVSNFGPNVAFEPGRIAALRERVQRYSQADVLTGCVLWTAYVDREGYGRTNYRGRPVEAHRAAYECLVGPIDPRLELDHLCRNRRCVNPDHLEPVTHRENVLRGAAFSAANSRKTHCKRGHPFEPANTYTNPSTGSRECRACARLNQSRAHRRATKAAKLRVIAADAEER